MYSIEYPMRGQASTGKAFTLIELLVVITIIVVLLALLTPALDKAIYQAELVACGGNLNVVGKGATAYAFEHRRRYPHRDVAKFGWDHMRISVGGQPFTNRLDDRPMLRAFLPLNAALDDPLTTTVDFDQPDENTTVYADYALWFGWRYTTGSNGGMYKVGDSFTWTDPNIPNAPRARFRLLASDWDILHPDDNYVFGSHPDADGRMVELVYDDEANPFFPDGGNTTFSWWDLTGRCERGTMDMNFASADGSVRRINDVEWDDSRLTRVPDFANKATTVGDRWTKLPAN